MFFPEKVDTTVQQAEQLVKELHIDKIALLSYLYVHQPEQDLDVLENLKALYVKDRLSIPSYAYAGFMHYSDDAKENADFMRFMMDMGFDGWKQVPIVLHLGDPAAIGI